MSKLNFEKIIIKNSFSFSNKNLLVINNFLIKIVFFERIIVRKSQTMS